jgi:adenine specific DNA methylase Mod
VPTKQVYSQLTKDTVITYLSNTDKKLIVILEHKERQCQELSKEKDSLIQEQSLAIKSSLRIMGLDSAKIKELNGKIAVKEQTIMQLNFKNKKLETKNNILSVVVIVEIVLLTLIILAK